MEVLTESQCLVEGIMLLKGGFKEERQERKEGEGFIESGDLGDDDSKGRVGE